MPAHVVVGGNEEPCSVNRDTCTTTLSFSLFFSSDTSMTERFRARKKNNRNSMVHCARCDRTEERLPRGANRLDRPGRILVGTLPQELEQVVTAMRARQHHRQRLHEIAAGILYNLRRIVRVVQRDDVDGRPDHRAEHPLLLSCDASDTVFIVRRVRSDCNSPH